ncbi:MAG: glgA3 [Solirubrobacterales bacterium]|nr:glgA3 [Solirubrobacterales bacterium]
MPRLRVISVQTSSERGGGEYAGVNLLAALRRAGADVELLTNDPGVAEGTDVPTRTIAMGPKLSRRTAGRVAAGFVPWLVRLGRELHRARARAPYDVLLVHYKKEQLMCALLPRRLRAVIVWAEWGPLPREFARGPARWAYRLAARRAEAIVAVSEGTARSLVAAGVPSAKITVVPNALDPDEIAFDPRARERWRRDWGASPETFVIGVVARLHPVKRNDVVIDALAHLPLDVMLVVAGAGPEEEALRRRAAPYDGRVRFLPTPRGYVHEILSACDVVVFAPAPTEGAPQAIAFGHLVGRPVVATAEVGADEIAPGTGTIVSPPHDPASLAATLRAYRDDPDRRAAEGERGRRLALRRYDIAHVSGALLAVFLGAAGA